MTFGDAAEAGADTQGSGGSTAYRTAAAATKEARRDPCRDPGRHGAVSTPVPGVLWRPRNMCDLSHSEHNFARKLPMLHPIWQARRS